MYSVMYYKVTICSKCLVTNYIDKVYKLAYMLTYKPSQCDQCDKTFATNGNLVIHQRIHSEDKPQNCNPCNKAITVSSTLVVHQRIHSEDKPQNYNPCDKAFTASSTLVMHQQIHS